MSSKEENSDTIHLYITKVNCQTSMCIFLMMTMFKNRFCLMCYTAAKYKFLTLGCVIEV